MSAVYPSQIVITDELLRTVMQFMPFSAHIKDAKTGKYISINKSAAQLFGFELPEKIIGMTVNDLNSIMHGRWDIKFPDEVISLDEKVISTGSVILNDHIFLNNSGFIRVEKMIKIPAISPLNRKTVALMTLGEDLTSKTNHSDLLNIYKRFYTDKKIAIQKLLQYLDINKYFHCLPTEAELRMLLAMRKNDSYKYLANFLHVNVKTIEAHKANLKDKINESLLSILSVLRDGKE